MEKLRWYNKLVARLIQENQISEYSVAQKAKLSVTAVHNARTGKHVVSMETLERILEVLNYKLVPEELPKKEQAIVIAPSRLPVLDQAKPLDGADPESYCWGCGKEATMRFVNGHWQCAGCGYIEPCCDI